MSTQQGQGQTVIYNIPAVGLTWYKAAEQDQLSWQAEHWSGVTPALPSREPKRVIGKQPWIPTCADANLLSKGMVLGAG